MIITGSIRQFGVIACLVSLLGQPLSCLAAGSATQDAAAANVEDVVIGDGGVLTGKVITQAGRPLPAKDVEVIFAGGVIAATQTDAAGNFQVAGLREGVHEIRSGTSTGRYRLWPKNIAPPQVQQVAHVSCCDDPPQQRRVNQPRRGPLARAFASYPVATTALVAAGIGAAIAIPIATSQKPASP